MMKMILFITNRDDITTDILINKLNKLKVDYFRLNTEEIGENVFFSFSINADEIYIFDNLKKMKIHLNQIASVYYRRPMLPDLSKYNLTDGEKEFLLNEIKYSLEGLYSLLKNCFWLNNVYKIREAENKIKQLIIAKEIGFDIPNTLITNLPNKAKHFISNNESSIIKAIKTGFIKDIDMEKVIFTSEIKKIDLNEIENIKMCPNLFQERIEKRIDLRVTVVGRKIFATEIHSQVSEESSTDWRNGESQNLIHRIHSLPKNIETLCFRLLSYFDLNFGAIDLILTNENKYVFLEINPNGQWGWIENRVNFNISDSIIEVLRRESYENL